MQQHNSLLWMVDSGVRWIILWSIMFYCLVWAWASPATCTQDKMIKCYYLHSMNAKYIRYQYIKKEISDFIFITHSPRTNKKHLQPTLTVMETLAAAPFHTFVGFSICERQTVIFDLFITGTSVKGCDRCMGAAWPILTFTRVLTSLNMDSFHCSHWLQLSLDWIWTVKILSL